MKRILVLTILLLFPATMNAVAQTKPRAKKKPRVTYRPFVPKVEVENWNFFESKDLNIKLIFPKEPTISETSYREFDDVDVKSTTIQSTVNSDYYMVEIREYPPDALPDRTDLGESYGQWLRRWILSRVSIKSEKVFDYGEFKMAEFVYQQSPNEVVVHRALVVGQKLYQIIVQFEVKKPETAEQAIERNRPKLDKFFLAFDLLDERFES